MNIEANDQLSPGRPSKRAVRTWHQRLGTSVYRVSWIYLVLMVALWGVLRFAGDRWWGGTLVLFGPLWATVLPVGVLLFTALFVGRRAFFVLVPAAWIGLFAVMGVCIPWRVWMHRPVPGHPHIRVMTCNIHGQATDKQLLSELVNAVEADVVVLQEWHQLHPEPLALDGHWYTQGDGELQIASRYPILRTVNLSNPRPGNADGCAVLYDLAGPKGTIHFINIHATSPHLSFQAIIDGDPAGHDRLQRHLAMRMEESKKITDAARACGAEVIMAGDFNTPPGGYIYHRFWDQFADAFSVAGLGTGHTYFSEGAAVRIDHIMTGSAWRCQRCEVQPPVGSPHRPVLADFELVNE